MDQLLLADSQGASTELLLYKMLALTHSAPVCSANSTHVAQQEKSATIPLLPLLLPCALQLILRDIAPQEDSPFVETPLVEIWLQQDQQRPSIVSRRDMEAVFGAATPFQPRMLQSASSEVAMQLLSWLCNQEQRQQQLSHFLALCSTWLKLPTPITSGPASSAVLSCTTQQVIGAERFLLLQQQQHHHYHRTNVDALVIARLLYAAITSLLFLLRSNAQLESSFLQSAQPLQALLAIRRECRALQHFRTPLRVFADAHKERLQQLCKDSASSSDDVDDGHWRSDESATMALLARALRAAEADEDFLFVFQLATLAVSDADDDAAVSDGEVSTTFADVYHALQSASTIAKAAKKTDDDQTVAQQLASSRGNGSNRGNVSATIADAFRVLKTAAAEGGAAVAAAVNSQALHNGGSQDAEEEEEEGVETAVENLAKQFVASLGSNERVRAPVCALLLQELLTSAAPHTAAAHWLSCAIAHLSVEAMRSRSSSAATFRLLAATLVRIYESDPSDERRILERLEQLRAVAATAAATGGYDASGTATRCLVEFLDLVADLFQRLGEQESEGNKAGGGGATQLISFMITSIAAASSLCCSSLRQRALVYGTVFRNIISIEQQHDSNDRIGCLSAFTQVACSHIIASAASPLDRDERSYSSSSSVICTLLLESCIEPLLLLLKHHQQQQQESSKGAAAEAAAAAAAAAVSAVATSIISRQLLPHVQRVLPRLGCDANDFIKMMLAASEGEESTTTATSASSESAWSVKFISDALQPDEDQGENDGVDDSDDQKHKTSSAPPSVRSSIAAWLAPKSFSVQLALAEEERRKRNAVMQQQQQNGGSGSGHSVQNRLSLLALQRAETTDRESIVKDRFSMSATVQRNGSSSAASSSNSSNSLSHHSSTALLFWASAHLQLHVELSRSLLLEFATQIILPSLCQLWFHTCVAELLVLRTSILVAGEAVQRRRRRQQTAYTGPTSASQADDKGGDDDDDDAFLTTVYFPLAQGAMQLLLLEAAERAPLGQQASSYSSASWLFEEERVVRLQVVEEDEADERGTWSDEVDSSSTGKQYLHQHRRANGGGGGNDVHRGILMPAFHRLRFCIAAERFLRGWAVDVHSERAMLLQLSASIVETVLTQERDARSRIRAEQQLLCAMQRQREKIESEREANFFFWQRVKRMQEKYFNEARQLRVQALAECCCGGGVAASRNSGSSSCGGGGGGVFASWVSDVLEPLWEEGIDKIYQLREEQGAEIAASAAAAPEKKQQRSAPPVVAAAAAAVAKQHSSSQSETSPSTSSSSSLSSPSLPPADQQRPSQTAATEEKEKRAAQQTRPLLLLPLHVATALAESEFSLRHDLHVAQIDAFERILFLTWKTERKRQ